MTIDPRPNFLTPPRPDVRIRTTPPCDGPIVIVGDGRSGTTLLTLMISAHPEIHVLPELHFTAPPSLGNGILEALAVRRDKSPRLASDALADDNDLLLSEQFLRRCNRAGLSDDTVEEVISAVAADLAGDILEVPDRLRVVEQLAVRAASRAGKSRWGFKLMKKVDVLADMGNSWPNIVAVHVVRDPRDMACSQVLDVRWGYSSWNEAAEGWSEFTASAERAIQSISHVTLRYEDLVERTEETMQSLLHALSLPWNDAVTNHQEYDHPLLTSAVRHDSAAAVSQPVTRERIGRHRTGMSRSKIDAFNKIALPQMTQFGYREYPRIEVSFLRGPDHGCQNLPSCDRYQTTILDRLGKRFFAIGDQVDPPVRSGTLNINDLTFDTFRQRIKKIYKGGVLRDSKKAKEAGLYIKPFTRRLYIPDIVDINTSMDERSGGEMKANYLKSVDELGGAPTKTYEPQTPDCPIHYDMYWGAFKAEPGHQQGKIGTDERLVAYLNFRRLGSFGMYNLIIGHGDFLHTGVMYLMHLEIMKWLFSDVAEVAELYTIVYAGFYQGGSGLQLWKKKAGFEPGILWLDPDEAQTA